MLIAHAYLATLELLEMVKHIYPERRTKTSGELEKVLGPNPRNRT
jgi:hypothetical protein